MKYIVKEKKHNPFLKREEVIVDIEHDAAPTPTKQSVQDHVAKEFGKSSDFVEVKDIFSHRGASRSVSRVYVWEEKKIKKVEEKKEEVKENG